MFIFILSQEGGVDVGLHCHIMKYRNTKPLHRQYNFREKKQKILKLDYRSHFTTYKLNILFLFIIFIMFSDLPSVIKF